jgi:pimeloyl-ACP methyl ester carboxylesterase
MSSAGLPQVNRRRVLGTLAAAGGAALAGGCASSPEAAGGATAAERGRPASFRGQVDIGGGRKIYLQYAGTGSPTVVLQSGYHDNAALWSQADTAPPAVGPPVFPGLAATSRVLAYDRPGTLDYTKNPPVITTRSSPVPMPRTAGDVVRELHALLARASVPGRYVLVGHSLGGLFMLLYARTYPGQVAGVVLVDAFSPKIPAMFGAAWPAYRKLLNYPGVPQETRPGWEIIDIDRSIAQLNAAPPLRPGLPLMVLSKTRPFALPPGTTGFTAAELQRIWNRSQDELPALEPQTPHLIATGSDHYIQVRQPDVVIAATRLVIARSRRRAD